MRCPCPRALWVHNPAIVVGAWEELCSSSKGGVVTSVFFFSGQGSLDWALEVPLS